MAAVVIIAFRGVLQADEYFMKCCRVHACAFISADAWYVSEAPHIPQIQLNLTRHVGACSDEDTSMPISTKELQKKLSPLVLQQAIFLIERTITAQRELVMTAYEDCLQVSSAGSKGRKANVHCGRWKSMVRLAHNSNESELDDGYDLVRRIETRHDAAGYFSKTTRAPVMTDEEVSHIASRRTLKIQPDYCTDYVLGLGASNDNCLSEHELFT